MNATQVGNQIMKSIIKSFIQDEIRSHGHRVRSDRCRHRDCDHHCCERSRHQAELELRYHQQLAEVTAHFGGVWGPGAPSARSLSFGPGVAAARYPPSVHSRLVRYRARYTREESFLIHSRCVWFSTVNSQAFPAFAQGLQSEAGCGACLKSRSRQSCTRDSLRSQPALPRPSKWNRTLSRPA